MINLAQKLFKGATSNANGGPGIVPAPLIADKDKYLKGDGTWGTPSGGGGIDGSTITPTDVVATWLECAGLHQSYTTIGEVLADSGVLYALINSTNAVDYMVRSTTWASSVCANQTAMNYIGNNNYCADVLLSDSTWGAAISASTYWEEVLSGLVPKMTSNTTPSGVVSATNYSSGYEPWKAFDGNDNTAWYYDKGSGSYASASITYDFGHTETVRKVTIKAANATDSVKNYTFRVAGSNDGTNYDILKNDVTVSMPPSNNLSIVIDNPLPYRYYNIFTSSNFRAIAVIYTIQYYGRTDLPPVDDRINAKADKTDIAPVENGTTASRAYAIGQQFYLNGSLYKAKAAIAQGDTFGVGNCKLADCITEQIVRSVEHNYTNLSNSSTTAYYVVLDTDLYTTLGLDSSAEIVSMYIIGWSSIAAGAMTLAFDAGKLYLLFPQGSTFSNRYVTIRFFYKK